MHRLTGRPVRAGWTRAIGTTLVIAGMAASAGAAEPSPAGPADRTLASSAALVVSADAAREAARDEQEAQDDGNPIVEWLKQIEVSGLVDGYYMWAFNEVDPQLRTFELGHNSFSLNYAEVAIGKPVSESSRAGFRLDFGAGDTADVVNSFEPGGADYLKHLQQAYVSYLVPAGKGLTVDFGKFVTPHGAEVIESHANDNYSRGLLFSLAIPFYHMGLRAAYPVNDKVTLTGFLVNGWNNVIDNNSDKTGGISIGATATDKLFVGLNYMAGKEGDEGDGVRHVFDAVVTYSLSDRSRVVANFDYGMDEIGGADAQWYGGAIGLKYALNDRWSVTPRYEIFKDDDGWATTVPQTLQEVTVTANYEPTPGFLTRFEFRSDFSDVDFFTDDDGGFTDSQPAFLVSFTYFFASR